MSAPWQPVPHTLALVKNYFEGYRAHDREIHAQRKHIAGKLKMCVRTLARYLKYLRESNWMGTVRRFAYTCIRRICAAVPSAVPSVPYKVNPEVRIERRDGFTPLVLFVSNRSGGTLKERAMRAAFAEALRD
jgi:hypothetical protein